MVKGTVFRNVKHCYDYMGDEKMLENQFLVGKCEKVLLQFPEGCIDLIVTSPPYADQRFYATGEFKIKPNDYVDWFLPKAKQFFRVLKSNGNFILNINDKTENREQSLYVFELLLALKKEIGFKFIRDYIWYNPATPPNIFSTGKYGRTKKSHEYCFWFAKGNDWTFNLDPIRKPYSKDMTKFLQGRGKGGRDMNTRPSTHSFDCAKIWDNKGGADPGSVIVIGNTNSNDTFAKLCKQNDITHPARFPEKLAEFFILAGSNPGDIVLDPFMGSGTTAIMAEKHNRRWLGIDANELYCELARQRYHTEFPSMNIIKEFKSS